MAFDPDGLSDVAALNRGRTLFEYGTRDPLASVLAAGYFDAAHGLLTTGDSILVSADDGEAIVRAAIVNGGAVVAVSQGGAGTANLGFAPGELGPGTVERSVADVLKDRLSVKSWLTVTDGSADQTTQLTSALTAAQGDGKPLWVPPDVTIRQDSPIACGSGPLRLELDGKMLHPASQSGFTSGMLHYAPATSASTTVSAISTVEYPTSSGRFVSRLTVASTSGWTQNAIAFVACTDLQHASDSNLAYRMAEIMPVVAVDSGNSYIYLAWVLQDTYATSITVSRLSDYHLDVRGSGSIEGNYDPWAVADGTNGGYGALIAEGCVGAKVDVRFRNLLSIGFRAVSCFDSDFTVDYENGRNNSAQQFLSYAADATCATRACRFDVRARNVRHAYTTNIYTRPGYPLWDAGAPRDNVTTGIAVDCTGNSWDTHAGCFGQRFENIAVIGASRDAQSDAGTQYAVQDRGCNTVVDGLLVRGPAIGLFFVPGTSYKYGRHNLPSYNNIDATNTDTARTATILTHPTAAVESNIVKRIFIDGITTRYYSEAGWSAGAATVYIYRFKYLYPGQNRWGTGITGSSNASEVHIDGMYVETNGASEPFTIYPGNTLHLYNWKHLGAISASTLVRANGTTGTATYRWLNGVDLQGGLTHYGTNAGGVTIDAAAATLLA